jgi:hypothetical protein
MVFGDIDTLDVRMVIIVICDDSNDALTIFLEAPSVGRVVGKRKLVWAGAV